MTKEEITDVLREVEADLKKSASEIAQTLRKDDGTTPEMEEPVSSDSTSPSSDPSPDAAADAGESPAPAGPPMDASASMDPAGAGDPAADAGGQVTPEALQAEYSQLAPEELDMHIQAALAAKQALSAASAPPDAMGAGAPAGMPPDAASAGGPPMDPAASAGGPPMMGKEELKTNSEANGGKISKSEKASLIASILDAVDKKVTERIASLQKSNQEDVENLSKVMTKILETPVRKSISALSDVRSNFKKSEPSEMTRKEADEFIKDNAHKMTKSERDLWLDFVSNKVPAAKLVPMLERLSSN